MDLDLLKRFIREYPFQPATAIWRTVEVGYVLSRTLPEGRGVDIGCGDGRLTAIVAERSNWTDIVGVDPDPEETRLARKLGLYQAVHTVSAAAIPEPDGSFDWAFSNSVLEHVDDIDGILAEVARVLRPGGEAVLTVPSPSFHRALRGPLLPWHRRGEYMTTLDARLAHRRYWGEKEWRRHLEPLGFIVTDVSPYMTAAETKRWETTARCTSGVLYALFRHRKHPIEIQRTLAMRQGGRRTPAAIAWLVAHVLGAGVNGKRGPYSCVFVHARKAG